MKFHGGRSEFKTLLEQTGLLGDWEEITDDRVRYRFYNGTIVNWWPRTKTLNLQGPPEARRKVGDLLNLML